MSALLLPEMLFPLLIISSVLAAFLSCFIALLFSRLGLPNLEKGSVGFFHPFADGGGGGERVLWCAVQALQNASPTLQIFIYVREGVSAEQLVADAENRFSIHLRADSKPIQVVPLTQSHLVLPDRYPRFTLIGQAIGSARLGREALLKRTPGVFIDTTGWAFTYPLAWAAGCKVVSYTHYPTVSTDMIKRVASRQASYNNQQSISGSRFKSAVKWLYYSAFAQVYGAAGGFAHVVMVNSSWTRRHVAALFLRFDDPALVYPPCDTERLQQRPLDRRLKQLYLISVAQFRPEKDHQKQLKAFAAAKQGKGIRSSVEGPLHSHALKVARLKMVGSCRGEEDEKRLADLKEYAESLGISGSVDWCVNVPFSELVDLLGDAVGGLHTMRDEHFGISVVEYMAAGAIPIAHRSAGPLEDIVIPWEDPGTGQITQTGFLADTVQEYAEAITEVLVMDQRERMLYAAAARAHAAAFSVDVFMRSFMQAVSPVLPQRCFS